MKNKFYMEEQLSKGMFRIIEFRARRKDTGEWVVGNYVHHTRKEEFHAICEKENNTTHFVYRESLQMRDWDGEFKDI